MSGKTDPVEKRTITLELPNVSTYMKKIGEQTRSPPQHVAGIGWHILAYPSVVDKVTYLSCFLEGENAFKWTAWVEATFRIVKKDAGGFDHKHSFRKQFMGKEPLGNDWGWPKFVTSEKLLNAANGLVVNNSIEIRVDISVTDVCGAWFNVFDTAGALAADIKLKVGDSVFYANKGYLSVMSSVFRDMFAFTEAAEGKKKTEQLELKDLDAGEFKEFLGVIYPTCYPIIDANVLSLFRIADRFDVKRVIADCEYHLFVANSVPLFDKLKLAADLNRDHLKAIDHLISEMPCNDITAINQNDNKDQLGVDVLHALLDKHIRICHP
ncbi:Protein BATH-38 [Aphelenchoides avenae]|nr:Protein BATH-38 [Aphelenchus avenae]